jgi:hypothetical protein
MTGYTEQNDYIMTLQQVQQEVEAARYEQTERVAEQICLSMQNLADTISQLTAMVSAVLAAQAIDNDMRITDE